MNESTKSRLRRWGDVVYRRTPYPISSVVYDVARASLFKGRKAFREWQHREQFLPFDKPGAVPVNKTFVLDAHR